MRRVFACLLLFLGVVFAENQARAATPSAVEDLTRQLRVLRGQQSQGDASALGAMVNAALLRQQRLLELIADRPAAVLRLALPAAERAALPAAVLPYIEDAYSGEGEIEVIHEDFPSGAGRYAYFLRGRDRVELHFAADPPLLMTGDRVRVSNGVRVKQAVAFASGTAQVEVVVGSGGTGTLGVKQTLVILLSFQDKPSSVPVAAATARTLMFGSGASVSNYFYEASYQRASLSGDVVGPYTIPVKSTGCDPDAIAAAAKAAASGHLAGYSRLVYAFPSAPCGWAGRATIGGSPGEAWINNAFNAKVITHEMGHNYGLYHSHAFDCGSVVIKQNCTSIEYGDLFDTMGVPYTAMHYNAAQKERLGWLNASGAPPITTVQTSGVYTLAPYETVGTDPKALKVKTPSGDWYYVEYRQPIGFDASGVAASPSVKNGVLVHFWDQPPDPDKIYVLDMTPTVDNWYDPGLAVHSVFTDASGIAISPVWANSGGVGVNVTVGAGTGKCVRNAPTVHMSPAQQQADAGATLSYAVSVTNNDVGCTPAAFAQTAAVPSGWSAAFDAPTLSISAGNTASTTVDVTSAPFAPAANYGFQSFSTNNAAPSYSNSTIASYVVVASGNTGGTFSDGFDRPDSPTLGREWTQVSGTLAVQSGEAASGTTRALHMAVASGLGGSTQNASATFTSVDNTRFPRFGVVLRYVDPKNYYACYRMASNSLLRIVKVVNGSERVLKSVAIEKPVVNQPFSVSCQVQGTALALSLDGEVRLTATDATFATGSVGFFMGYAPGNGSRPSHRADNFGADVQ
jgi:hypothetical protein